MRWRTGGRLNWVALAGALAVVTGACSTSSDVANERSMERHDTTEATTDTTTEATTDPTTDPTTEATTEANVEQDPDVRVGTLDNGLTYYIRHNEQPGYSAELRLVINAGSGREQPDQVGVAHFLEHMMFNGTTTFPKNDLIDVLRASGSQFGADLNAYTDYDETVFQLHVPTRGSEGDQPLTTGLDVLEQWLSSATLDSDLVASERGVVLDEWRGDQQSASGRVGNANDGLFLADTPYDGHSPIGTDAAIEAMSPEVLRRFYDDWYRPDNAAVVAVGDFDVDAVEAGITERFRDLQPRSGPPVAAPISVVPSIAPRAVVFDDPDLTTAQIEVTLPVTARAPAVSTTRADMIDQLANSMIVTRLSNDAAGVGAPFDDAFASDNNLVRSLDAPSVVVDSKSSSVTASAAALLDEFERVHRFGFDPNEFAIAVRQITALAESEYESRDSVQDASFADIYADAFLTGAPILSGETWHDLITGTLTGIAVDDVSAAFQQRWSAAALHVLVSGPDVTASVPDEAAVLAAIGDLPNRTLEPREAIELSTDELMEPPAPLEETEQSELLPYPDVFLDDPLQLRFANGATVILSTTSIASGSVVLLGRSPGGLAVVADSDVADAVAAVSVVTTSGVGSFGQAALDQHLASTSATLEMWLDYSTDEMYGSASTADLESLLQLLHLYMTAPRVDDVALERVVSASLDAAAQPDADQQTAGYDALSRARYPGEPRFLSTLTTDEVNSIDGPTVARLWDERFGNAADWSFAILGDFDMDRVIDLARRYLGTLATTGDIDPSIDLISDAPAGVVSETAHGGTGEKGDLLREYSSTDLAATARNRVIADVANEIVTARLDEDIREALGQSYSPSAYFDLGATPHTEGEDEVGHVSAFFEISSAPDQLDTVSSRLSEDLAQLATDGPTDDDLEAALAILWEQYGSISNEELADVLLNEPLGYGETIAAFVERFSELDRITPADIAGFLTVNLPADRYVEIQVLPR